MSEHYLAAFVAIGISASSAIGNSQSPAPQRECVSFPRIDDDVDVVQPPIQLAVSVQEMFDRLATEWRDGTQNESSFTVLSNHPAYVAIGDMGADVLPILFREMRRKRDWWFMALERITKTNPVPRESRGNIAEMTRLWIEYAIQHGYLDAQ